MKFKDVAKGTRAITRVKLPLCNSPGPLLADQAELAAQRAVDGHEERSDVDVGIRALKPGEFRDVIERAQDYARSKGLEHFDDRNPVYSLAYNLNLLALACVDPDSDPKDPEPFFGTRGDPESAIAQILDSDHLTRDSILFLAEHQESWQDAVAPQATKIGPEQLWEVAGKLVAEGDGRTFLGLRPGAQLQCARFLASQCLSLLMPSSQSDSASSASS